MSALLPKADIRPRKWDVRLVPKAEVGQVIRSPRRPVPKTIGVPKDRELLRL